MSKEASRITHPRNPSLILNALFMIQLRKGFTLIELLIVIGVIGVLAAGVFTALNVVATLGKASLSKAKTFAASVENDLSISQVGKWSFDDSATPGKDTSGYGNEGTLTNGAESKSASDCALGFGGCVRLNGSTGYVQASSQFGDVDLKTKPFTVAAWIKLNTSASGWNPIAGIRPATNSYYGLELVEAVTQGAYIVFYKVDGSDRIPLSTATDEVKKGVWNHIVFTYNGNGTPDATSARIYVNGAKQRLSSIMASTAWFGATNTIRIGAINTEFFNGLIDEVYMYSQALTIAQVEQLYVDGLQRHQLVNK